MKAGKISAILGSAVLVGAWCLAEAPTELAKVGQSVADQIREAAGVEGAFVAEGLIRQPLQSDNLATALQYPTDEIVVVSLTGAQVKQAFERSVSLYPKSNSSFLHVSGFEIVFDANRDPNARVVSVDTSSGKLEDGRTYEIAMPSSLGRGGLGYFKIWDKSKIVRTVDGKTVESVTRGKTVADSKFRWSVR